MNMTEEAASKTSTKKSGLRCGFSTGTAATAAATAALRCLIAGTGPDAVAVRLPLGVYLPVSIRECRNTGDQACASVIKDAGDDPDITDKTEIKASIRAVACSREHGRGLYLVAGKGVGTVTKPGLPVAPGEPAVNPVPRRMICDNLARELLIQESAGKIVPVSDPVPQVKKEAVFLPFDLPGNREGISLEVELEVPEGEKLARHTLNPRLGIVGGISILGTTGIVKPFSHEAYEETIQAALSVAASNGCDVVVLSTGGKSEKYARDLFPDIPVEAFVQVADFFAFAVREARRFGFKRIMHSVFFGKAVKMAQGHAYTHAHSVPMELELLAGIAGTAGYDEAFCRSLVTANTARHALEIISGRGAMDIVTAIARKAREESIRLAGEPTHVRLLLFDFNGSLLADVG